MVRDALETFAPRDDRPLIIEFVNHVHDAGFPTRISFAFWDFEAYDDDERPALVVKTVRNTPTEQQLTRLVTDETPVKVLLIDGPHPKTEHVDAIKPLLAATGTAVFVRGHGWRLLPGSARARELPDVRLRLAPRWNQDPDGTWLKACSACGELKGTDSFYRSPYPTSTDPFRHVCKACYPRKRPKTAPEAAVGA